MKKAHLFAASLVLLFAVPAGADCLVLRDGRIVERPTMEKVEGGYRVSFEHGDVVVPARLVEEAVLTKADADFKPTTDEEREKAAKGLVLFEGRWMKPAEREELLQKRIAERKAKVEDIKQHQMWKDRWKEETRHFRFEHTVPPYLFDQFRDTMEAYFESFSKEWRVRQPKEYGKLTVCFYTDIQKFDQIAGVGGGILGYFRYVEPLELDFFYDRLDPELTEEVMFHETNHYLQKLLNPKFDMPHFPGESLAEYYGASKYDPKKRKLETGLLLEGRLVEIQDDIAKGKTVGLQELITTPQMYEHYTWGWSLVHFLMHDKKYRKEFERFIRDLAFGKDVKRVPGAAGNTTVEPEEIWEVFKQDLKLKDADAVNALEKEWHDYVKNSLQVVTVRGLEQAAESAMRTGMRPIRATRLFKEAVAKGSQNPNTFYSLATLQTTKGQYDDALANCQKAIDLDPLEGRYYGAKAKILLLQQKKDEAKKAYALAKELDPDNPYFDFEFAELASDLPGN